MAPKQTTYPPFREFLFDFFNNWEKAQPGRRSTYTEFAKWLSDNSFELEIKQTVVSYWMNGTTPSDEKYVWVLAEKLGDQVYDLLRVERPDSFVLYTAKTADRLKETQKRTIEKQISKFLTANEKESRHPR